MVHKALTAIALIGLFGLVSWTNRPRAVIEGSGHPIFGDEPRGSIPTLDSGSSGSVVTYSSTSFSPVTMTIPASNTNVLCTLPNAATVTAVSH